MRRIRPYGHIRPKIKVLGGWGFCCILFPIYIPYRPCMELCVEPYVGSCEVKWNPGTGPDAQIKTEKCMGLPHEQDLA